MGGHVFESPVIQFGNAVQKYADKTIDYKTPIKFINGYIRQIQSKLPENIMYYTINHQIQNIIVLFLIPREKVTSGW